MAVIKKKKDKALPAVNTSALPDIVFMLLFFFMVATVMREVDLKVSVNKPQATEIQKSSVRRQEFSSTMRLHPSTTYNRSLSKSVKRRLKKTAQ